MLPRRHFAFTLAALGLLVATACNTPAEDEEEAGDGALVSGSGPSLYRPGNRFEGWGAKAERDEYLDEIQPILAKRCVTCHGCTTSPCQLKLTSFEGLARGANAHNYFAQTVLSASTGPTRIKDGKTADDWKAKGFYSVAEGGKSSILYRMLEHGKNDNKPGFDLTNAYSLYDDQAEKLKFACLDSRRAVDKRVAMPGTGMPFGLPTLPEAEYAKLTQWIERGAPGPAAAAQRSLDAPRDPAAVADWEELLNGSSVKSRLSMRYVFEHLFYGKLHIDDSARSRGDFFDLVRSRTRTGPIDEIVTERPSDDPKVSFSYRLKKHTQVITAKDHIVVHLDAGVKKRWKELFLDGDWDAGADLPGYSDMNPFRYFERIPGRIRYQFMLESSHHLIEAMVTGDVCNGSAATYAIRDRFFTLFLKPDSDPSAIDPKLGQDSFFHLDPNSGSIFRDMEFEQLFEAGLRKLRPQGLSVDDLWDGGKKDRNALISVFRHGTNASAHQGPLGQFPETMWVLDYGNFERLYYDLVVLYRPWGALPHKLSTWRQMSHVRAHGEDLFLLFFPERFRDPLRKQFTPGWASWTEVDMAGTGYPSATPDIDTERPLEDFVSRVRRYLGPEIAGATELDPDPLKAASPMPSRATNRAQVESALRALSIDRGNVSEDFPDVTWLMIDSGREQLPYTILANRVYWHNSRVVGDFMPGLTRRPELDSLSVVPGHVGAFPQLFLQLPIDDVVSAVRSARAGHAQRIELRQKYEVRRNTPDFWTFLDKAHGAQLATRPLEAGIIDTSRYVWPMRLQSDTTGALDDATTTTR